MESGRRGFSERLGIRRTDQLLGNPCGPGENLKETQKERAIYAPQPLPRSRPRSLTSPLPASPNRSSLSWNPFKKPILQQTLDQSQSILFARLPLEVRQLIWTKVLGARVLHIARTFKRLIVLECAVEHSELGPNFRTHHGCWGFHSKFGAPHHPPTIGFWLHPFDTNNTRGYKTPPGTHPAYPADLLPLLQTCRRIYTEAITILYKDNVFDLNHVDTLFYLKRSVLPQRLCQIRSLRLAWDFKYHGAAGPEYAPYDSSTWRDACSVLASFSGLRDLSIYLMGRMFPGERAPVLEAMMDIKATNFRVFVTWSEDTCAAMTRQKGYPFRLVSTVRGHPLTCLVASREDSTQMTY